MHIHQLQQTSQPLSGQGDGLRRQRCKCIFGHQNGTLPYNLSQTPLQCAPHPFQQKQCNGNPRNYQAGAGRKRARRNYHFTGAKTPRLICSGTKTQPMISGSCSCLFQCFSLVLFACLSLSISFTLPLSHAILFDCSACSLSLFSSPVIPLVSQQCLTMQRMSSH